MRRALLLALLLAFASGGAAQATTVSGTLAGIKLPKRGHGLTAVHAVDLETDAVVGADRASRGKFALKVPPGVYLLVGTVTPFHGRTAPKDAVSKPLRVTRKRRRGLRLRVRRHRRKKARAAARPGFVDVPYPAIWVQHFDVSDASAEFSVMAKGMSDMLITDLVALEPPACPQHFAVVDRDRIQEVLDEQRLQQSPLVDPSTRVRPGRLIEHNTIINGRIATAGATMRIDAQVHDLRTGRVDAVSVSGPDSDVFALEQALVGKLAPIVCNPPSQQPPPAPPPPPPPSHPSAYSGSVSGSYSGNGTTVSWSGSLTASYTGRHAGSGNADYWYFAPSGGTLHVTVDNPSADCSIHGAADIPVTTGQSGDMIAVQADTTTPSYEMFAEFAPTDAVPITTSGPSCSGQGSWPLTSVPYLRTTQPQQSSSPALSGSASQDQGGGTTAQWQWDLSPAP